MWKREHLPPVLVEIQFLEIQAWQWIGLALVIALALFAALVVGAIARSVALRLTRRTPFTWDDRLVEALSGPGRFLLGLGVALAGLESLHLSIPAQAALHHVMRVLAVVAFTWAALRSLDLAADLAIDQFARNGQGEAAHRGAMTQIMMLKHIAGVVALVVGGSLVLLQFDGMRALGTSLLASAGVAGIVIGFAAQRSLSTLLAGIQLSFTQPIRVGDVVIVEGEWGIIEEITLTYVAVKIWDLRRLIVPITRFLEAPFQNWTRAGTDILGTVFIHADYRVPVEEIRRELERFVKSRSEWDGKVAALQVTGSDERTLELRALVSSADSNRSWDLRCAVREHLVAHLQQLDGGRYLPRTRIEPGSIDATATRAARDGRADRGDATG